MNQYHIVITDTQIIQVLILVAGAFSVFISWATQVDRRIRKGSKPPKINKAADYFLDADHRLRMSRDKR